MEILDKRVVFSARTTLHQQQPKNYSTKTKLT